MEWISVKYRLPENDEQLCCFIEWYQNQIIKSYISTWRDIKLWRSFELRDDYTHWIPLPEPPKGK